MFFINFEFICEVTVWVWARGHLQGVCVCAFGGAVPCSSDELIARLSAQLTASQPASPATVCIATRSPADHPSPCLSRHVLD